MEAAHPPFARRNVENLEAQHDTLPTTELEISKRQQTPVFNEGKTGVT